MGERLAAASAQPAGSKAKAVAAPPAALRAPAGEGPAAKAGRARKETVPRPDRVTLAADESAAQRDRLIGDLEGVQSSDEAADWVHKNLSVKNSLTIADADQVEARFRKKLATLEATAPAGHGVSGSASEKTVVGTGEKPSTVDPIKWPESAAIVPLQKPQGRRRRVAPKAIRLRDKEHCKYVAAQPCTVCGRMPSEAHHIRFAQPRALGRKVSDEYTVPVCRLHHRELHRYGDEASW